MRVLIGQPVHENNTEQFEKHVRNHPAVDMVVYPEGYLTDEKAVIRACAICRASGKALVAGYRRNGQNRALIVNRQGERVLDREKARGGEWKGPFTVDIDGSRIGCLLCREIFIGPGETVEGGRPIDLILNPIDTGMYGKGQLREWIGAAGRIAKAHHAMVIGGSHSDGTFKGHPVSIPIAYCIDAQGNILFIAQSDPRPRIVDLRRKSVQIT